MFEYLQDLIAAHWGKMLGCIGFLMFIPAYVRARYYWRKRWFLTRVNFSINFVEDNTLKFRTIRETDLEEAMLRNAHAVRVLVKAVGKSNNAVLIFQDRDDAWTILTTILNELSASFAEGFVARGMGLPTRSEWFYIGITCEQHADLKATKFRVMIVSKALLEQLDSVSELKFEQPHHHVRLLTLKQMWAIAQDEKLKHNVMLVELSVKA